jgi:hypothetical protein
MERRKFIEKLTIGAGGLIASPSIGSGVNFPNGLERKLPSLEELERPLAMAMWDFSWILRHHRYGEFEDWDQVLEGLAERGYDAIRIDIMPQYVARDTDGELTEEFRSVRKDWAPVKWGNQYTMNFRPREALLEFLPLCREYGVRVGLSSWFVNHNTGPRKIFNEEGGALRAWKETLEFLNEHHLLDDNIIYADLLNEYPKWHGYDWFRKQMNDRGDVEKFKLENPEAFIPDYKEDTGEFNPLQLEFQNKFANDLIESLQPQYPDIKFHLSITQSVPLENIDISRFGTLDYHIWMAINSNIPHWGEFRKMDQSKDLRPIFAELEAAWKEKRQETIRIADHMIGHVAHTAKSHNITCGNTEGWGPVEWLDHPDINWNWIKDAADICVDLAKKHHNYKFICTSNFTHPQFKGMWEDKKWHKEITKRIKS